MGGSVALAARFNDGETICVDGWTNFVPNMVMNGTTLSGDDSVVRRTLMAAAVHKAYKGPLPFRAKGYGMIAIDFVAREIHSMQGYTGFRHKTLNQVLDLNATGYVGADFVHVISDQAGGLIDQGRISAVARNGEEHDPIHLDREKALSLLREEHESFMSGRGHVFIDLEVATAPFVVHDYPESGTLVAMKERLRTAGFPMTKEEGLNRMFAGRTRTDRTT